MEKELAAVFWMFSCLLAGPGAVDAATVDLFVATPAQGMGLSRFDGSTGEQVYANNMGFVMDVVFGEDGLAYVSMLFDGTVQRVEPLTGEVLGVFASGGGLNRATGLTFGPDGHLYVCSSGDDRILRYDGVTGGILGEFAVGITGPEDILFGPDGFAYVTQHSGTGVLRLDGETGVVVESLSSRGLLSGTRSLAFGPDGALYVSGHSSANIVRFDLQGALSPTLVGTGIPGANGLAFSPDGTLHVASESGNAVYRFEGRSGREFTRVSSPIGISFAPVPEPLPGGLLLLVGIGALGSRSRTRLRPDA